MYDRWATNKRKKSKPEKYINYEEIKSKYGQINRDIENIKRNCISFYVISDDNDEEVPQKHQIQLKEMLSA
ncbi:MAG: hypothetical protein H6766_05000 [Candidatus Peribacteria bacterium]|nr:MAG: hypothetical protein H6766_05000 [Candidatus Peribacteria bacterium]